MDNRLSDFIIENSSAAVLVTDGDGYVIYRNTMHEELTHYKHDNILGKHISNLVDEGAIHSSASLKVIKTGEPLILEQTVNKGKASEKSIMVKSIPLKDGNDRIEYVINYLYDISEKATLLNQLKKTEFNNQKYKLELDSYRESTTSNFIYTSKALHIILEKTEKIAQSDSTVLITGESGTGKTLLAKHIHSRSKRNSESFLPINCGAIPANLIESELFGYEKGAFSGADAHGKHGIFDYANHGTLLLDEIADLPFDLQVKLLTVLQSGEFYRVGGKKPISVDVRIIAATNANLMKMVKSGNFRLDLFYRLNVVTFEIPPLRERREDIPLLVESFLKKHNRKMGTEKRFSPRALNDLLKLPLYGNVRELENIMESNLLFSLDDTVESIEISNMYFDTPQLYDSNPCKHQSMCTNARSGQLTRETLVEAIECHKTTTELANHFGVNQSTISRRLRKYGINLKEIRDNSRCR